MSPPAPDGNTAQRVSTKSLTLNYSTGDSVFTFFSFLFTRISSSHNP